jgi:FolB domain-containing protein
MGRKDIVRINDLMLEAAMSSGARWLPKDGKTVLQPLLVTTSFCCDLHDAATADDLAKSINYSSVSALLRSSIQPSFSFDSLEDLSAHLSRSIASAFNQHSSVILKVVQPKPPLHCERIGVELIAGQATSAIVEWFIEGFQCDCIVGVNLAERNEKQPIRVHTFISVEKGDPEQDLSVDFRSLIRHWYQACATLISNPIC